MAREEDKHRGPEYVPVGPVRIRSTSVIERQDAPDARLLARIEVLESQVASLQFAVAAIERRESPLVQGSGIAKAK